MTFLRQAIAITITALGLSVTSVIAQTVSIQNGLGEYGFGWMFSHQGLCYAVMPQHVAGPLPRVTIATATPVETGTGTVIAPFWPGIDLALAVVRGNIAGRCVASLSDMRPIRLTTGGQEAQLLRLRTNGEEERVPIRIGDRGYLTFLGEVIDPADEIGQGTSGAFAFVGAVPLGMAITSGNPARATFMRSEEIVMNVTRFLVEQGAAYADPPAAAPVQVDGGAALPLRLTASTIPPVNPQFAPENLLGQGLFIFAPARRMVLDLEIGTGDPTSVRRFRMLAPVDAGYAWPRSLLVQYATGDTGSRYRDWMRLQMGPDGIADSGLSAPRNMSRVRVVILDTWGDGAVAIDTITLE